jgi:hypothetical protein
VNGQSDLAEIVKPDLPRAQWYKLIVEILPGERDKHFVDLPGDYMVVAPLVSHGLPGWAGTSSSDMVALEWKLGSLLFMKGGTKLFWSGHGGGKLFVFGVKHGTRKH